jgi:hypothetical protein
MKLYRAIDIWRKRGDSVIRYRCFHILKSNKYCVQSADFYESPVDGKQTEILEQQFIELLIEEEPDKRAHLYDSIEEAILAHDRDFENE